MSHSALRDYLRAAAGEDPAGPADTDLLVRFAAFRDDAAFELLVWRHAALVQRICRSVLGDFHAAEDAAQASFLILARRAHVFSGGKSVVGWLYRVARRVAVRLAKDRARRAANSIDSASFTAIRRESQATADELEALWAEVDRLPERYRVPVLLCYFEGLTHAEAAHRTGWAIGTVAGRLARAKDLLARRLSRKGLGVATLMLALPASNFVGTTARAAAAFAARRAVVPAVSQTAIYTAEGALSAMKASKLQLFFAATSLGLALATGLAFTLDASSSQSRAVASPLFAEATIPIVAEAITSGQNPVQPAQPERPPAKEQERIAYGDQRLLSQNTLKQLLLAMHNYASVNKDTLPHDILDATGKPLLSWRVAILPYLEQSALYEQFKLDEPWDSKNNKKLLGKMPRIYRVEFQPPDSTMTYYQVFAGPGTPFESGKTFNLASITDGTSNTIGIVEAGPPVEWTKPADIAYDAKKPLPKLELPYKNIFNIGMMDGSVRSITPDPDADLLKRAIEHADGKPAPDFGKLNAPTKLTREEIERLRTAMKQSEKNLAAIVEQIREQHKLLGELAQMPKLSELQLGNRITWNPWEADPSRLADALREIEKQNEELRKVIEAGGKKQ